MAEYQDTPGVVIPPVHDPVMDTTKPPTSRRGKLRAAGFLISVTGFILGFIVFFKLFVDFQPPLDFGSSCGGYSVKAGSIQETSHGFEAELHLNGKGCEFYSPDVPHLRLVVEHETDSRLHVVIQDYEQKRYQVPEDIIPRPKAHAEASPDRSDLIFSFSDEDEPFSFSVTRRSTGDMLFDTAGTGLVFERQFLRLKTWLPRNPNLYGLGEHSDSFRLPTKDYKRTLWARDAAGLNGRSNLYGSHPVYMDHRLNGTHGVFLVNSNGIDIVIDEDNDEGGKVFLEYRAIGGIFDFYFLAGPGPTEVAQQYAKIVGTPTMMPYWSLGFHQCKYGYQDWFEVAEVVHNYSVAGIPMETIWTDIDYMDHRRIFTFDQERFSFEKMQDLMTYLRGRDQHYILMIDPAVADYDYHAYNRGTEMGVWLSHKDGSPFRGVVWPGVTVFPDWWHPNATKYWTEMFAKTFDPETGVDIDGVWIDMNEPASFCGFPCDDPDKSARNRHLPPDPPRLREPPRSIPEFPGNHSKRADRGDQAPLSPPHQTDDEVQEMVQVNIDHEGENLLRPPYEIDNHVGSHKLSDRTVYTDLKHANGQWTYDAHNLYGMLMGTATYKAMLSRRPNQRPFIITRSTFAGSGRYTGKWLGDNFSKWDHYRLQIPQMLAFASIFQIPMVGSDVCGFMWATNEKLCARWTTLGAFNPFYRNHADDRAPNQEFYLWPLVTDAAKYAIDIRYRLLDYIYTALARQSDDGTPTLRPLWHIYPQDEQTFSIQYQYFYGDCILVSPVTGDSTNVKIYLPDDLFYDFHTGKPVRGKGQWIDLNDVPYDKIPLYIRGGCAVPMRTESAMTTTELREKGFEIVVAPGLDGKAKGSLYVDDGETLDGGKYKIHIDFEYSEADGLATKVVSGSSPSDEASLANAGVTIEKVTVLGGSNIPEIDELPSFQDEL